MESMEKAQHLIEKALDAFSGKEARWFGFLLTGNRWDSLHNLMGLTLDECEELLVAANIMRKRGQRIVTNNDGIDGLQKSHSFVLQTSMCKSSRLIGTKGMRPFLLLGQDFDPKRGDPRSFADQEATRDQDSYEAPTLSSRLLCELKDFARGLVEEERDSTNSVEPQKEQDSTNSVEPQIPSVESEPARSVAGTAFEETRKVPAIDDSPIPSVESQEEQDSSNSVEPPIPLAESEPARSVDGTACVEKKVPATHVSLLEERICKGIPRPAFQDSAWLARCSNEDFQFMLKTFNYIDGRWHGKACKQNCYTVSPDVKPSDDACQACLARRGRKGCRP